MLWTCVGVTAKVMKVNNVQSLTRLSTSKNTHRANMSYV